MEEEVDEEAAEEPKQPVAMFAMPEEDGWAD